MDHGRRWLIDTGLVLALAAALILIAAGGQPTLAEDGIIYVDADADPGGVGSSWEDAYTDLQDALDAADTPPVEIWVAEGTYKPTDGTDRTISFQMANGVAIYGGFDPSAGDTEWEDRDWANNLTTLSGDIGTVGYPGDNSYHVFYHPDGTGLDDTAILDGFTITGGNANALDWPHDVGGGMFNYESSPALANLTLTGHSASHGGGMYNDESSSPELVNCAFEGNSVTHQGGGMYNQGSSSPTLTNCTFTVNTSGGGGGAMVNSNASPTLTNCTFESNSAEGHGGGMYNYYSSPTMTNCAFEGNSAVGNGGGMVNAFSAPTLTDSAFEDNSADLDGGGIYHDNSHLTLANCTFEGNMAAQDGGGIGAVMSSLSLNECTFKGNTAYRSGGGMSNEETFGTLTNCAFTGNSAGEGGGINNYSASPRLTNCTLAGNTAIGLGGSIANYYSSEPTLTNCILWGNTKPEIWDDDSTPVVTYSDVQDGYPGTGNIDADPLFVDAASGDLHLQLASPAIDAGDNDAPELAGITADLGGNPRLADVLSVADTGNGDPPIVDMGAYETPPEVIFVDLEAAGDNDGSTWDDAFIDLQDALAWGQEGVEIWVAEGTYKPTDGTDRTISFQMANGVAIYGGFDPSAGETEWEDRDWGSNVTILSGDLAFQGASFDNAYHVFYHPDGTNLDSNAVLDGFTITAGNADGVSPHDSGGGMYNYSSSPSLANLTLTGNTATSYGGGLYNFRSSPVLLDCTLEGNSAEHGGGLYNTFQSSPTVTNCIFWGNSAANGGGMENSGLSSPTVTNCTFWENSGFLGSGIYNRLSSPEVTNCILWGVAFSTIYNEDSSPDVTHSNIKGGFEGAGNINADPRFVDPDNGDFHLRACSPCIDAGNNVEGLPEFDFEGDARIFDGDGNGTATVDMGVDEVAVAGTCSRIYLPLVLRGY